MPRSWMEMLEGAWSPSSIVNTRTEKSAKQVANRRPFGEKAHFSTLYREEKILVKLKSPLDISQGDLINYQHSLHSFVGYHGYVCCLVVCSIWVLALTMATEGDPELVHR